MTDYESAYRALMAKREQELAGVSGPGEQEYADTARQQNLGTLVNALFKSQALMGSLGGKPTQESGIDMAAFANNDLSALKGRSDRAQLKRAEAEKNFQAGRQNTGDIMGGEKFGMDMKQDQQKFDFDAAANPLKLQDMQQDVDFAGKANPLRLQGMQQDVSFDGQANPMRLQDMRQSLEMKKQEALRGGANPTEYDKAMARINQIDKLNQTAEQYKNDPVKYKLLKDKAAELSTGVEAMTKATLSPGEAIVEKKYANEFSDWESKGRTAAERTIGELKEVATTLGSGSDMISGGLLGRLPDGLSPNRAILTRDKAQRTAIEGLKEALGAQFTEKDREVLTGLAYNPNLSEAANKEKIDAQIKYIEKRLSESNSRSDYFKQTGYIKGYNPSSAPQGQAAAGQSPAAAPKATMSSQDKQALDWAKSNPNDPRAAKIILKLGGG